MAGSGQQTLSSSAGMSVLRKHVGREVVRLRRVWFTHGGEILGSEGPLEITFDDGATLVLDAGADGQASSGPSRRRRRGAGPAEQAELERLRRQNEKLTRDLARNQASLEIMGKAHALLELLSESTDPKPGPGSSR